MFTMGWMGSGVYVVVVSSLMLVMMIISNAISFSL